MTEIVCILLFEMRERFVACALTSGTMLGAFLFDSIEFVELLSNAVLLSTVGQLVKFPRRPRIKPRNLKIRKKPQVRGTVIKLHTRSPKKPNSANRRLAHVITSLGRNRRGHWKFRRLHVHVPGEEHELQPFNRVLLRGAGLPDLPGIHQRCLHGNLDMEGQLERVRARSKYGVLNIARIKWIALADKWTKKVAANDLCSPEYDEDGVLIEKEVAQVVV